MEQLKYCIQNYRKLDDALKDINSKAQDIRREKKMVETDLSTLLSKPEFQQYDKLELKEDNSVIKIQRPGGWTKGWTMSKSELMEGLDLYFSQNGHQASSEGCYAFLVERQKPKMVANEFSFERSVVSQVNKKMKM
jgi:hypothetical protein